MAWNEASNTIPFGDIINWNTDRTVSPVTMVHGMMGKSNGSWVYLQVTSAGALVVDGSGGSGTVSAADAPLSISASTISLNLLSTGGLVLSASKLAVGTSSWINRDANGIKLDSTSSGTFSGTLVFSGTNTHTADVYVNGDMWMTSAHAIAFTDNNASNYVGFRAPATVSVNSIWNLPSADGGSGQLLTTNGSGALSWYTPTAGTGDVVGPASATDNAVVRYDGTTGKLIQNTNVTIADSGDMNVAGALTVNNVVQITGGQALRVFTSANGFANVLFSQIKAAESYINVNLPSSYGSNGDMLITDNSGNWSWTTPGIGTLSTTVAPLYNTGASIGLSTLSTGGLVLSANTLAVGTSSWINRDANGIKLDSTSSGTFSGTLVYSGLNTHTSAMYLSANNALRFYGAGNTYTALVGAAAPTTVTMVLPSSNGSASDVIKTDGAGVLSWYTPTIGTVSTASVPLYITNADIALSTLSTGGLVLSANKLAVGTSSWMSRDASGVKLDSTSSGTFSGSIVYSGLVTHTSAMYLSANNAVRFYGTGNTYTGIAAATTPTTVTMILPSSNGSSGDVLKTDGAGTLSWTGAGSSSTPRIIFCTPFEAIGSTGNRYSFSAYSGGTAPGAAEGGITYGSNGQSGGGGQFVVNTPGGTDPSESLFGDNFEMQALALLTNSTATAHIAWVTAGTGTQPTVATGALTAKHIGFISDTTVLSASNANGTTQTVTDISSGVTLTAVNTWRAVMNGSTDCKFYVNKTLKATHTTNLPTGAPNTAGIGAGGIRNDVGVTTSRNGYISFLTTSWDGA